MNAAFGEFTEIVLMIGCWKDATSLKDYLSDYYDFFDKLNGQPLTVYLIYTEIEPSTCYPPVIKRFKDRSIPDTVCVFQVPNSLYSFLQESIPPGNSEDIKNIEKNLSPTNTVFATDAFFAIRDTCGQSLLICPLFHPNEYNNMFLLASGFALSSLVGFPSRPLQFTGDGGNMLYGGNFLLAGKDIFYQNRKDIFYQNRKAHIREEKDWELITSQMKDDFHVDEVIWIGTNRKMPSGSDYYQGDFQPLYHIDFFVTPLGVHPVVGKHGLHQVIVVGEARHEDNGFALNTALYDAIRDGLDEVAAQLQLNATIGGYPVHLVRIPIVFFLTSSKAALPLSYNNSLIEVCHDGRKIAFVPRYTYNEFLLHELAVAVALGELGFETRFVKGDYSDLGNFTGGGLHCEVNVIGRNSFLKNNDEFSAFTRPGGGMMGLM
jgi:hypothetical protein